MKAGMSSRSAKQPPTSEQPPEPVEHLVGSTATDIADLQLRVAKIEATLYPTAAKAGHMTHLLAALNASSLFPRGVPGCTCTDCLAKSLIT